MEKHGQIIEHMLCEDLVYHIFFLKKRESRKEKRIPHIQMNAVSLSDILYVNQSNLKPLSRSARLVVAFSFVV